MKNIILKKQGGSDSLLTNKDSQNGGDYSIYSLSKMLQNKGLSLKINGTDPSEKIIHWDHYKEIKNLDTEYLIVREPPCIIPRNHNLKNLQNFKKVFTWNRALVDNKKIFQLPVAQRSDQTILKNTGENFCCLISSNKFSFHKNELYSERKKAIKYFEENCKEQFSLYGYRWNAFFYPFKSNVTSLLKKDFSILKFLHYVYIICFDNYYKSYEGTVDDKLKTLSKYKFCICYENQTGLDGYITEKIWDCFFTGCIPIYLGSDKIEQYIPAGCFIDKRDYSDYKELYAYMESLSGEDIEKYKQNITLFLKSQETKIFYTEQWCNTVLKNIDL